MYPATSPTLNTSLRMIYGETWGGIPSFRVYVNTNGVRSAPSTTLSSAKMQFKSNREAATYVVQLTSGSGITISDSTNWIVTVPKQALALPVGGYFWVFQTTDSASSVESLMWGEMTVDPAMIGTAP